MPSISRLIIRGDSNAGSSFTMPHLSTVIIVCTFAGVAVLGVGLWFAIRLVRRSVRGMTSGHVAPCSAEESVEHLPKYIAVEASTISLPKRAFLCAEPISENVTSYEASTRALVRLLEPSTNTRPASFRLSVTPASKRSSYASTISSFPAPPSSRLSGRFAAAKASLSQLQGQTRIVRRKFTPVLPDELLLGKVGERLTVVKPFDDGWCLVSHVNHEALARGSGLAARGDHLGVVPVWCFMEPVRGQRPQRPVRRSSAGISVEMDAQFKAGGKRRGEVMSWSDF